MKATDTVERWSPSTTMHANPKNGKPVPDLGGRQLPDECLHKFRNHVSDAKPITSFHRCQGTLNKKCINIEPLRLMSKSLKKHKCKLQILKAE